MLGYNRGRAFFFFFSKRVYSTRACAGPGAVNSHKQNLHLIDMAVKISDPESEINLHAPFPRASRRIASIPCVHPSPARLFLDGFTKTPLHIHEGK